MCIIHVHPTINNDVHNYPLRWASPVIILFLVLLSFCRGLFLVLLMFCSWAIAWSSILAPLCAFKVILSFIHLYMSSFLLQRIHECHRSVWTCTYMHVMSWSVYSDTGMYVYFQHLSSASSGVAIGMQIPVHKPVHIHISHNTFHIMRILCTIRCSSMLS